MPRTRRNAPRRSSSSAASKRSPPGSRLGRACAVGRLRAARDPGRARPHRATRESAAPAAAAAGASGIGARRARAAGAGVALETLAEQADLARDAGREGGRRTAQLLQELAAARDRSASRREALKALRARWQQSLGLKVSTEALQTGGARQGLGKSHGMAEVEVARPESASRAAAAGGARLGARRRDGARLISRGRVRRRARCGRGSAGRASTAAIWWW